MSSNTRIPVPEPLQPGNIKQIPIPAPLKPAAPDNNNDIDTFQHEGPVWWVGLTNDQTHALTGALTTGAGATAAVGLIGAAVAAALVAAAGYIEAMNSLFGSNGVDVNGVIGVQGVVVTPRTGKLYGELIQAARLVVSGVTIMDFIVIASSKVPALAAALEVPAVASIYAAVSSGTPLGWAIAGAVGLAVNLLDPAPDPNAHGSVMANRDQAQQWESFTMGQLGRDNKVSLLSWVGLFSAQNGGGQGVYANRTKVGDWETWNLITNSDGTVSFQTHDGHFLCAEEGGGRE